MQSKSTKVNLLHWLLGFSIPLLAFAEGFNPDLLPLTRTALEQSVPNIPCHEIKSLRFRAGTYSSLGISKLIDNSPGHYGKSAYDSVVIRNDEYPVLETSGQPVRPSGLEWTTYEPGDRYSFVPVFDGDKTDKFFAWVVYRHKVVERPLASQRKVYSTQGVSLEPVYYPGYDFYVKNTRMADSWPTNSGLQTPYILDKKIGAWKAGIIWVTDHTERWWYGEACERVDVIDASRMANISQVYNCTEDLDRPGDYINGSRLPTCLAKRYLGAAEFRAKDAKLGLAETSIRLVGEATPIVGSTMGMVKCVDSSDPVCWGGAIFGLVGDVGTLLVPLKPGLGKKLLALSIAADTTQAGYYVYKQEYMDALAKLAGGTFDFIDLKNLQVGSQKVLSATARKGKSPDQCKLKCETVPVKEQRIVPQRGLTCSPPGSNFDESNFPRDFRKQPVVPKFPPSNPPYIKGIDWSKELTIEAGTTVAHGTIAKHAKSILTEGVKDVGSGVAGRGLYLAPRKSGSPLGITSEGILENAADRPFQLASGYLEQADYFAGNARQINRALPDSEKASVILIGEMGPVPKEKIANLRSSEFFTEKLEDGIVTGMGPQDVDAFEDMMKRGGYGIVNVDVRAHDHFGSEQPDIGIDQIFVVKPCGNSLVKWKGAAVKVKGTGWKVISIEEFLRTF